MSVSHTTTPDATTIEPVLAASPVRRGYALLLMALVSSSQVADRQLLSIAIEPIKSEFGFSDTQMGFLAGTAFGVAYAIGVVPFAILADRWSRRKVIALTLAFWSALTALTASVSSYASLVATRALVGLGEAGAGPAMLAYLSRYYPPPQRARMVSVITAVTGAAGFAAYWLSGAVIERFGWRALFLVFGLPGLVLAALIVFTLVEPGGKTAVARRRASFAQVRDALVTAPMLLLFSAVVCNGMATSGVLSWMPSYLVRTFRISPSDMGFWVGVIGGAGGVAGAMLGGWLAGRMQRRDAWGGIRLAALSIAVGLPLALAAYMTDRLPLALAGLAAWSALGGMASVPIGARLLDLMPEASRATSMAVVSMGSLLVSGLGATLVGKLSDALSAHGNTNGLRDALLAVTSLSAVTVVLLSILIVVGRRANVRERDSAAQV